MIAIYEKIVAILCFGASTLFAAWFLLIVYRHGVTDHALLIMALSSTELLLGHHYMGRT